MTPTARKAVKLVYSVNSHARTAFKERRKTPDQTKARWLVWAVLRAHGWSLPQIGTRCGGFDHTTVLHGIRQIHKYYSAEFIEELAIQMRPRIEADEPDGLDKFAERLADGRLKSDSLKTPGNPKAAAHALSGVLKRLREARL